MQRREVLHLRPNPTPILQDKRFLLRSVSLSVLGSRKPWFDSVPERSKAKDPAPLKILAAPLQDDFRVVDEESTQEHYSIERESTKGSGASSGDQGRDTRKPAFSFILGRSAHAARARVRGHDPQRPGVRKRAGGEGRSTPLLR